MKRIIQIIYLLAITPFLFSCAVLREDHSETTRQFHLSVIHINDTHSFIEAAPLKINPQAFSNVAEVESGDITRLAHEVKQRRSQAKNNIFLHAGDLTQGSMYAIRYNGDSDIFFYNYMQLDAMVTGNHEYDQGTRHLADLISDAQFPILAANVEINDDPFLRDGFEPYIIKNFDGEQVGVIGLVSEHTAETSSPGKTGRFMNAAQTAEKYIKELSEEGVNKIILLTHMGYENDLNLAAQLNDVDIIVGGHSHYLLGYFEHLGLEVQGDYPTVVTNRSGEEVLIITAGSLSRVLGQLDVVFDGQGHITSYTAHPALLISDTLKDRNGKILSGPDAERAREEIARDSMIKIVDQDIVAVEKMSHYRAGVQELKKQIVGKASEDLTHRRMPSATHPEGSMIAPIVCDSMLWRLRSLGDHVDFALLNAGAVRTDIYRGDISQATVRTLLPFKNKLVTVKLTGAEIKDTLETALSNILDQKKSDGAFPYVAGMRYEALRDKPEGERVQLMEILTDNGANVPLRAEQVYTLVTNSYLAKGKDGYTLLAAKEDSVETKYIDTDVFIDYLKFRKTIKAGKPRVRLD